MRRDLHRRPEFVSDGILLTMKIGQYLFPALLITATIALGGSTADGDRTRPRQPMTTAHDSIFHPSRFVSGWEIDTMMALDLDGRGGTEYLVVSHAPEVLLFGPHRIQVFAYDPRAHAFRAVLTDSAGMFGVVHSWEQVDLTGDGVPEVVATLNQGGNDEIASMGMAVYSGQGGRIRKIFKSLRGDPELTVLQPGGPAIFYYQKLWPRFVSHVLSTQFVSDIFAFRNGTFVSVRREHPEVFLEAAKNYLDEYQSERDSNRASKTDTADWPIAYHGLEYVIPATLAMANFRLAGADTSLRRFWNSERAFLQQRLPKEFFDYLKQVYQGRARYSNMEAHPEIPNLGYRRRHRAW